MAINQTGVKKLAKLIILAGAILFSTSAFAAIYKWTDEQGNVHYGQQRPTTATSEKMNVQQHAPENTSTYNRPGSQKDAKSTDKSGNNAKPANEQKAEKKTETKAEKKKRLAACEQARKSLKTMEEVGRIRAKDKDGNTTFLSQQQKEEKMKQSRKMLSKHCK